MTTAHGEQFEFYQIGFRCCADAPAPGAGSVKPAAPPAGGAPGNKPLAPTNPAPGTPLVGS
jgi:hypothetical protein